MDAKVSSNEIRFHWNACLARRLDVARKYQVSHFLAEGNSVTLRDRYQRETKPPRYSKNENYTEAKFHFNASRATSIVLRIFQLRLAVSYTGSIPYRLSRYQSVHSRWLQPFKVYNLQTISNDILWNHVMMIDFNTFFWSGITSLFKDFHRQ